MALAALQPQPEPKATPRSTEWCEIGQHVPWRMMVWVQLWSPSGQTRLSSQSMIEIWGNPLWARPSCRQGFLCHTPDDTLAYGVPWHVWVYEVWPVASSLPGLTIFPLIIIPCFSIKSNICSASASYDWGYSEEDVHLVKCYGSEPWK